MVEAERFLVQPQDAVVSRGQSHVLQCTVEDRAGEVQWLRDGFGFGPGDDELEGFPRYRIQRNDQRGKLTHFQRRILTAFWSSFVDNHCVIKAAHYTVVSE